MGGLRTPGATHRSGAIALVATATIALVVGCSTTSGTDGGGSSGTDGGGASEPVDVTAGDSASGSAGGDVDDDGLGDYVAFMEALCASTDDRIDALPSPPDQIRADLWATEVATAFAQERDRADLEAQPPDDVRRDHRAYVETTAELVDAWTALSTSLAAGADDIEDRRTDVTQLALGRNATAATLGLTTCDRSSP